MDMADAARELSELRVCGREAQIDIADGAREEYGEGGSERSSLGRAREATSENASDNASEISIPWNGRPLSTK